VPLARSAATRLIDRHGEAVLATARRYSASREDAEDAYQRGLEILLTKAPDLSDEELLPWLKTVVKHEAFAIWRGRDRVQPVADEGLERAGSTAPPPQEHVESYERLAVGAQAIAQLKPQEVRCLLLRADGLSYKQICETTGWTYTKVNRCLTEGRRRFLDRVAGIESGAECDRLAPLLSALADGEATADDLARLRPHLRSCLACRGVLRAYREIPHRVAELVPLAGAEHLDRVPGALARWLDYVVGWIQDRVALVGAKVHAAPEAASATKVAAVAASAAAIAGGAVALRAAEAPGEEGREPAGRTPDHLIAVPLAPPGRVASHARPALEAVAATEPTSAPGLREAMGMAPGPPSPAQGLPGVDSLGASEARPSPSPSQGGGYGGRPPDPPDEATVPVRPGGQPGGASEEGLHLDPLTTPWSPPETAPASTSGPAPADQSPDPPPAPAESAEPPP
jgi:RNA polymerase sigma factor (sigma-70 family)